jgi:hypothetical protein
VSTDSFHDSQASRARATRCFMHVHYWPGETVVVLGNLLNKVRTLSNYWPQNRPVEFDQNDWRVPHDWPTPDCARAGDHYSARV